jgi:Rrf2 family transcriptional regulator, iron-sulfur cluster assembly transcription factor
MKLSTKGRYAVTAMMDLAIHDKIGPVTLADISQCQGISLSYLEQLFAKLRKQGLVEGVRGPGGGYRLARPPTRSPWPTSSPPWTKTWTSPGAAATRTVRMASAV